MIPNRFKNYLLEHGAGNTSHSGATLWSHLSGVHRILSTSGADARVCMAGLFHSIYGTTVFGHVTVNQTKRPEVRELIGGYAEDLVWHFCTLPRPKLFEDTLKGKDCSWIEALKLDYSRQEFWCHLLQLECANLLEQKKLYRFQVLVRHAREIGMLDREGFSV
ncbi:DUF6817 domain-containing protein [Variovorax sp. ZT4R33]|uniref:DUF6817 domain-containing protein n=1 Tax=Variovorax sp. ZT4R33 TaxID=3443743 RepID=UPI003F450AAC